MWRIQIFLATLLLALLPGVFSHTPNAPTPAGAAAPPCNNYLSEVTPPENIGVAITQNGAIVDVVYVEFKSYVKDLLPNEWLPGWNQAAYQAGALAVKHYGWYFVNHWDPQNVSPGGKCYHVRDDISDQVYVPGSSTIPTAYATEQTWNTVLQSGGRVYPTFHLQGLNDQCGQLNGGNQDGRTMSQYGSQACASAGYTWLRYQLTPTPMLASATTSPIRIPL